MRYKCPGCGMTEVEKKEIQMRIIHSKTMKPIKIQPAWEFACVGCGWVETKDTPELAFTA